jgi:hypothetical protein
MAANLVTVTWLHCRVASSVSPSEHGRFFAAAADYCLTVRTDGDRNVKFSHFPRDLVQSVCALHKHKAFVPSQYVLRPYHSRNLNVAGRIDNYRLTRARRMVACAFGILCNKWRIFHRAIEVYPDFCDVIVKTCCILHNFVRQTDGFQFQDTLYECPLEIITDVATRGNVTGTDMGRRAQGTGTILRGGPRRGAWQGACQSGTYVWKKALETDTHLHTGPVVTHWGRGCRFTRNS